MLPWLRWVPVHLIRISNSIFANLLRRKCLYFENFTLSTIVSRGHSKRVTIDTRGASFGKYIVSLSGVRNPVTLYLFFDIFLFWLFTRQFVCRGQECVQLQRRWARHHFSIHSRRTKNSILQKENHKNYSDHSLNCLKPNVDEFIRNSTSPENTSVTDINPFSLWKDRQHSGMLVPLCRWKSRLPGCDSYVSVGRCLQQWSMTVTEKSSERALLSFFPNRQVLN